MLRSLVISIHDIDIVVALPPDLFLNEFSVNIFQIKKKKRKKRNALISMSCAIVSIKKMQNHVPLGKSVWCTKKRWSIVGRQ